WIATQVLVTPYDDIEFGAARSVGRSGALALHAGQRWCSFILLPLLALVTGQRLLIIGGARPARPPPPPPPPPPGPPTPRRRARAARRAALGLVHPAAAARAGHRPAPADHRRAAPRRRSPPGSARWAESVDAVRVAWQRWLTQRVKVIDEYNRIPTKTQSALL